MIPNVLLLGEIVLTIMYKFVHLCLIIYYIQIGMNSNKSQAYDVPTNDSFVYNAVAYQRNCSGIGNCAESSVQVEPLKILPNVEYNKFLYNFIYMINQEGKLNNIFSKNSNKWRERTSSDNNLKIKFRTQGSNKIQKINKKQNKNFKDMFSEKSSKQSINAFNLHRILNVNDHNFRTTFKDTFNIPPLNFIPPKSLAKFGNFSQNKLNLGRNGPNDSIKVSNGSRQWFNGDGKHLRVTRRASNGSNLRVARRVSNGSNPKIEKSSTKKTTVITSNYNGSELVESTTINSSYNSSMLNVGSSIDYWEVSDEADNSTRPTWIELPVGKVYNKPISTTLSPVEILHKLFINSKEPSGNYKEQLIAFVEELHYRNNGSLNLSTLFSHILPQNDSNVDKQRSFRNFLKFLSNSSAAANVPERSMNDSSPNVVLTLMDTEGIVRIPCYGVIFLLGIVGNSLVILTLLQNRKMRTVTNVFLLNLAISDLLLGVFCMPFTLVGSLLRDFVFGAIMCRVIPYFQATSISVSVWTLVAISLERHYAICHPLQSRGWQTLSHAYKVISIVWVASFVVMTPIASLSELVSIGNSGRHKCREVWPLLNLERSFSLFLAMILLLVPLVIMVAAYSSISVSLWHGMKLERQTGQGSIHLISLTDLNSLAVVQQSLRSHSSTTKKQASKISIRFRKYPSPLAKCSNYIHEEPTLNSTLMTPNHSTIACISKSVPSATDTNHVTHPSIYSEVDYSITQQENGCENGNGPSTISPCHHHIECSNSYSNSNSNNNKLRSTHLEKSIAAKRHVIKMLFVVVIEFFICWTPIFVVNILYLYIPEQVYATLGSVGISFLHLLSYASSCCNPITYCFMNRKFLQGFKQDLKCCRKRRETKINLDLSNLRSLNSKPIAKSNHFKFDRDESMV